MGSNNRKPWDEVAQFWFPEGRNFDIAPERHRELWRRRLHGGADDQIVARFADLTRQAATGALDHWMGCAEGRLALIILLDQFSRSIWRDTPRAFTQDPAALALVIEGLANGDYAAMPTPWHKITFTQPLGHAEGPDHLARIDRLIILRTDIVAKAPPPLQPIYQALAMQAHKLCDVIARFGRHPHRNAILGRTPTTDEAASAAAHAPQHRGLFSD